MLITEIPGFYFWFFLNAEQTKTVNSLEANRQTEIKFGEENINLRKSFRQEGIWIKAIINYII